MLNLIQDPPGVIFLILKTFFKSRCIFFEAETGKSKKRRKKRIFVASF